MTERRHWLTHLLRTWRALAERIDADADAAAIVAGLTVEHRPGGVRRYRDPRLDQLTAHRASLAAATDANPARVTRAGGWSTPTLNGTPATSLARCLDCAAHLHVDEATGALVDRWCQTMRGASCRARSPELPVLSAGPAAPANRMPVRLRRADLSAGAGAVPLPTVPPQGRSAGSASLRDHPRVALDPGHPAAAVSGAPSGRHEEHAPARPETGPRIPR